ncbi:hypothetical protein [Moheibacter stercoris]|uniref:Major capsid protein n=1 Tax=Moheibacter stercoris TaxID=1628251 RepID=A0ABV2LPQ0_9FLAO
MARQRGIIKIKGTIGDITFYKSKDGYMVREKGGVEANRIATDPAFQRTRENGAEFGRAGKAGKTIRTALRPILLRASDGRMVGRLTQQLIKVLQTDPTSVRGERAVHLGDSSILKGFEFNIQGKLSTTFFAPYVTAIDRVVGELKVDIDPFVPTDMIMSPEGATHYRILSGGTEVDFPNETYVVSTAETAILPIDGTLTTAVNQTHSLTPNSTLPMYLVMGIEFFQEVNGTMYPLRNGAFNPMGIVEVENAV